MANLSVIASTKVNGVAEIHSGLVKTQLFPDFYEMFPDKFTNVTNGVTPRRWIHCAFPELSAIFTKYNGNNDDWLAELDLLDGMFDKLSEDEKKDFIKAYKDAKLAAKLRMKDLVKKTTNIDISEDFLFDVIVKRIHEYKRQFMDCLYCIYRYFQIKRAGPEQRKKFVKRVSFFGGKAAPGYAVAKSIIKVINIIANYVNNDRDTNPYFKMVFLPDYKVSRAQIIIPAADINQQISTAGTEASGTSCMKFVMTGSRILGTRDGANIEIAENIGEENMFFFGKNVHQVEQIRSELANGKRGYVGGRLKECFDAILQNRFGDTSCLHDYVKNLTNGGDYYLVCHDFDDYIQAQERVDREYQDQDAWVLKCIHSITRMGFFSSDRAVKDYADNIWKIQPLEVPKPSLSKKDHFVSSENLKNLEK